MKVIYLLLDADGDPRYIGYSANIRRRLAEHRRQHPWLVTFVLLDVVHPWQTWQEREQFWIEYYLQFAELMNIARGGNGTGWTSWEARANLSKALKGKKKPPRSKQHSAAIAASNQGKRHSEETKLKMSLARKGKPKPEGHAEKIRKSWEIRRQRSPHNNGHRYEEAISCK